MEERSSLDAEPRARRGATGEPTTSGSGPSAPRAVTPSATMAQPTASLYRKKLMRPGKPSEAHPATYGDEDGTSSDEDDWHYHASYPEATHNHTRDDPNLPTGGGEPVISPTGVGEEHSLLGPDHDEPQRHDGIAEDVPGQFQVPQEQAVDSNQGTNPSVPAGTLARPLRRREPKTILTYSQLGVPVYEPLNSHANALYATDSPNPTESWYPGLPYARHYPTMSIGETFQIQPPFSQTAWWP